LIKKGNFRLSKVQYPDGIGCCVWTPLDEEDDSCGVCYDFDFDEIDDLIQIIREAKTLTADIYEETETVEQVKYTFFDRIKNVSFEIKPFNWKLEYRNVFSEMAVGPFRFSWPFIL